MMMKQEQWLRNFGVLTVAAIYFLIFVGGVVRSTGAGMGCPDWPKCFGQWIPPTDMAQLPENYQQIYSQKRIEKNKKISAYLVFLGYDELAKKIESDPAILEEQPFNALKTWIEYLNRLLGAAVGLFILVSFFLSLYWLRRDYWVAVCTFLGLVLVLFQAWLGSIVVSTNLLPGTITVHMLVAQIIVLLMIYAIFRTYKIDSQFQSNQSFNIRQLNLLLGLVMILSVAQLVMGTQVREEVDQVALRLGEASRAYWVDQLPLIFKVHRSFSILVLISNLLLFRVLSKSSLSTSLGFWAQVLVALLVAEIASGAIMAYFALPKAVQPVHLLLGSLVLGVQFIMLLLVNSNKVRLFPS
jgi:cytochrome c oxidase assembly protein subunit 15